MGELRWQAPRPPEPWEGVRDATRLWLIRADAEDRAGRAAAELGCVDGPAPAVAECLRAVPAERLAALYSDRSNAKPRAHHRPAVVPAAGTPTLPRQPLDALQSGMANHGR
nr:carboxylesterase family protein [Pseudonocardia kunmingensis]